MYNIRASSGGWTGGQGTTSSFRNHQEQNAKKGIAWTTNTLVILTMVNYAYLSKVTLKENAHRYKKDFTTRSLNEEHFQHEKFLSEISIQFNPFNCKSFFSSLDLLLLKFSSS